MAQVLCDDWVHSYDVKAQISAVLDNLLRYRLRGTDISVRRPTKEDGCWCYRIDLPEEEQNKHPHPRPHKHEHALGKCPVEPAFDRYVRMKIEVL